jgi:NADP-dependent 3-hydroxy acid dehydrogenase YdfG
MSAQLNDHVTAEGMRTKYGPWAVIAGASEGTGAEFARQLCAVGINCVLVARRLEPLQRLADAYSAIKRSAKSRSSECNRPTSGKDGKIVA